jgi:hypothetical protein
MLTFLYGCHFAPTGRFKRWLTFQTNAYAFHEKPQTRAVEKPAIISLDSEKIEVHYQFQIGLPAGEFQTRNPFRGFPSPPPGVSCVFP